MDAVLRALFLALCLVLSAALVWGVPRRVALILAAGLLTLLCTDLGSILTVLPVLLGGFLVFYWLYETPGSAAIPWLRYAPGLAVILVWFALGVPSLLDSVPMLPGDTKRAFVDAPQLGEELGLHADGAVFLTFMVLALAALGFRRFLRRSPRAHSA